MNLLAEWTSACCDDLDLEHDDLDHALILRLARETGRAVARPAAPVTAYLFGVAVGRGLPPAAAAERIGALARRWPDRHANTAIDWRD